MDRIPLNIPDASRAEASYLEKSLREKSQDLLIGAMVSCISIIYTLTEEKKCSRALNL